MDERKATPPRRRHRRRTMKRDPNAPRRFKSAFIMYAAQRQRQVREELRAMGDLKPKSTFVSKLVSQSWKALSPSEREMWEQKAKKDKERYEREKASYDGPWRVPVVSMKKDPTAPKRPITAYFLFSNSNRALVSKALPQATNGQISRILSKMWKSLPPEMKAPFLQQQQQHVMHYRQEFAKWKSMKNHDNTRSALQSDSDEDFEGFADVEEMFQDGDDSDDEMLDTEDMNRLFAGFLESPGASSSEGQQEDTIGSNASSLTLSHLLEPIPIAVGPSLTEKYTGAQNKAKPKIESDCESLATSCDVCHEVRPLLEPASNSIEVESMLRSDYMLFASL